MKIKATAIRSKPDVSLTVATGRLELKADDLVDSAILTAIYGAVTGKDARLSAAIVESAKRVAKGWKKVPKFVMRPVEAVQK